jgi:hypothetical protein
VNADGHLSASIADRLRGARAAASTNGGDPAPGGVGWLQRSAGLVAKVLCHNQGCLILAQCELGIDAVFWLEEPKPENPDVLPLVRGS